MPVLGTYGGVSIIALPTDPAPRQIALSVNNNVAAPTNPFTGADLQVLAWPGGDWWTAQIALPKLRPCQIPAWNGFIAELRGRLNVFRLADSSYRGPQGNVVGVPLVNGAQAPMALTLATKGWGLNTARVLVPGDLLQVGERLHRVTDVVNSDSNGYATVPLWPSLRDAVTDGQAINLNKPTGLFRMKSNSNTITIDETRLGAFSFDVVEAR